MPAALSSTAEDRTRSRALWLALIAALAAAALWLHGPIAQWADYHAFADQRAWLGVPNAENVLSNLPFLAVGACALWRLRGSRLPTAAAWRAFAFAVACTAAGSAFYHWAPSNETLVGDRLPIAWACAALLCAFLAERVDARWSEAPVLAASLALATLAVAWWWATERAGHGDLRPYLAVQFLPMLLVPAALWLGLAPKFGAATPARAWWTVLGLYAAAKLFEMADRAVFDAALTIVSGHTIKHLLAAAGAGALLLAATRRPPAGASADQLR